MLPAAALPPAGAALGAPSTTATGVPDPIVAVAMLDAQVSVARIVAVATAGGSVTLHLAVPMHRGAVGKRLGHLSRARTSPTGAGDGGKRDGGDGGKRDSGGGGGKRSDGVSSKPKREDWSLPPPPPDRIPAPREADSSSLLSSAGLPHGTGPAPSPLRRAASTSGGLTGTGGGGAGNAAGRGKATALQTIDSLAPFFADMRHSVAEDRPPPDQFFLSKRQARKRAEERASRDRLRDVEATFGIPASRANVSGFVTDPIFDDIRRGNDVSVLSIEEADAASAAHAGGSGSRGSGARGGRGKGGGGAGRNSRRAGASTGGGPTAVDLARTPFKLTRVRPATSPALRESLAAGNRIKELRRQREQARLSAERDSRLRARGLQGPDTDAVSDDVARRTVRELGVDELLTVGVDASGAPRGRRGDRGLKSNDDDGPPEIVPPPESVLLGGTDAATSSALRELKDYLEFASKDQGRHNPRDRLTTQVGIIPPMKR
jgi:hypothetical protein